MADEPNIETPPEESFDSASETPNEDGSVDVDPTSDESEDDSSTPQEYDHYENIAASLPEEMKSTIAEKCINGFDADKQSSKPWSDMIVKGLKQLGLKLEEMSDPFEGACGASHPLILESAVKFQARAAKELFPPGGPVKTQIIGLKTPPKLQQAARVAEHMNYQINEVMEEYFPDMENLLLYVPIIGIAFKKMYYDQENKVPCSEFVPADHLVVPANAVDLKRCQRYTHILYKTELDMLRDIQSGMYLDLLDVENGIGQPSKPEIPDITKTFNDLIGITASASEEDEVYTLLEQHCYLSLEGTEFEDPTGLPLPYVVTIEKGTSKILAIRRNWKVDDPNKAKRVWFVKYPFVPGFGFYSLGFIHLLGNLQLTLTTSLRSLVDSGQFATLQGGFKAKGVRLQNNDPLRPGEWKEMECMGGDIQKALLPLPAKEPSATLFQMYQTVQEAGQKFADSTEQVISDSTNYGPVGTTLALLEASTKFFSGIHKRLHFAQKQEFKIMAELNQEHIPPQGYEYDVVGGQRNIMSQDYNPADVAVVPCSDPNISSNAHRMALAQTKLQVAQQFPGSVNTKPLIRDFFYAIADGTDPNEYITPDGQPQMGDPVSDIASAVKGKPIGAFPGQDHSAHVKVKSMWLQDPGGGKHPAMKGIVPAVESNIRDHLMMHYQETMGSAMKNNGQDQSQMQQQQPQPGQPPQPNNMMEAAQAAGAPLVAKANAMKSELEGTQDPVLIAALSEKQAQDNKAMEIQLKHKERVAEILLKKREIALRERELDQQDRHHTQDMGKEMVSEGMDRNLKDKHERLKAETTKHVADTRPKPSSNK